MAMGDTPSLMKELGEVVFAVSSRCFASSGVSQVEQSFCAGTTEKLVDPKCCARAMLNHGAPFFKLNDDFFLSGKWPEADASSDVGIPFKDARSFMSEMSVDRKFSEAIYFLSHLWGGNSFQNFRGSIHPIAHNDTAFDIDNDATRFYIAVV